jgi:hypothetical protein
MLMAEEVLLLLVDDRTGRFLVDSTRLNNVLAGAVLVELVTIERVGFPPAGGGVKRGRMVVVDPTPLGDPVLDGALATVAVGRPAKPEQVIAKVRKRLRATLLERLTAAGALRRSTRKVLGIPWPCLCRKSHPSRSEGLFGFRQRPPELVALPGSARCGMKISCAVPTGLSECDERVRVTAASSSERPGQGRRDPGATAPAECQKSATGPDLVFYAARSYSLMRPPRTGRHWIRAWERSGMG